MDTIQYLFSALIRLAVALIVVAIVWWLISSLFPMISARNLLSLDGERTASGDWLPAPRNGLLQPAKPPSATDNVYQSGEPFNGYGDAYTSGSGVSYVTYTSNGTQVITSPNQNQQVTKQDPNISYVRNLSLYQGGHLYTGLTFTGDAREIMFKNGKFPIVIVDSSNRVVGTVVAEATTNWTIPGWVKFQAKINGVLPNKVPCTLVFEQALSQNEYATQKQPIRVPMPALCN